MKNVIKIVAVIVAGTIIALSVFMLASCRDGHAENAHEGYKYTVQWRDLNGWWYEVNTDDCVLLDRCVKFCVGGVTYRVGWANVIVIQHYGVGM